MSSSSDNVDNAKKWSISLYSALLFFIIASPLLFALVNRVTNMAGVSILNQNGCPNIIGLALHAVVFLLIVRLSMEIKN